MKWIWPLNWWFRIRELEALVDAHSAMNRELSTRLMRSTLEQSALASNFAGVMHNMMVSMATQHADELRRREEAYNANIQSAVELARAEQRRRH